MSELDGAILKALLAVLAEKRVPSLGIPKAPSGTKAEAALDPQMLIIQQMETQMRRPLTAQERDAALLHLFGKGGMRYRYNRAPRRSPK